MCFSSNGEANSLYPDLMIQYLWNNKYRNDHKLYNDPSSSRGLYVNDDGKWALFENANLR